MPGNNYSMSSVRPEFSDTLDCIESLFNTIDCNAQICCGDYNVSFDKRDAHLEYLKNFISRNNLYSSWDHSITVLCLPARRLFALNLEMRLLKDRMQF